MGQTIAQVVVAVMPLTGSSLTRREIVRRVKERLPARSVHSISSVIAELAMGPHAELERISSGVYRRRFT